MVGRIGIEVKIDGPVTALLRQLHRYAQLEQVEALIAVVGRVQLSALPDTLNGKPVHVVIVPRGF